MAIITPPSAFRLRRAQWRRPRSQQVNRGWSGKTQIVRLPSATRWTVSGEFVPIRGEAASLSWQAFFEAIDGGANIFPVIAVEGVQTAAAAPTVAGAGQTGSSLALTGLTGTTGATFLPKGAKISIALSSTDRQLEVLQAPIIIGAGGTGTATFAGTLRSSPANGASVEVGLPTALMRLTSAASGWDVDAGQLYGFAFEAEEGF